MTKQSFSILARHIVLAALTSLSCWACARPTAAMAESLKASTVVEPKYLWSLAGTGADGHLSKLEYDDLGEAVTAWKGYIGSVPSARCGIQTTTSFGHVSLNDQQTATIGWIFGYILTNLDGSFAGCSGGWDYANSSFTIPLVPRCPQGFEARVWFEDFVGNPDPPEDQRARQRMVCSAPVKPVTNCPDNCPSNRTPVFMYGNPIEAATRTKVQYENVLPAAVADGLTFTGVYRSDTRKWSHTYSMKAVAAFLASGSSGCVEARVAVDGTVVSWCFPVSGMWDAAVMYEAAGGRQTTYVRTDSGRFTARPGDNDLVLSVDSSDNSVLMLTPDNWMQKFDAEGRSAIWQHVSGAKRHFLYSDTSTPVNVAPAEGMLIGVTDDFGRTIGIRYAADKSLYIVVDVDDLQYVFDTDELGNWTSIVNPDSSIRTLLYDEPDLVGGASGAGLLTGYIDELGVRIGTYSFDSAGLAISTEGAAGSSKYTWTWPSTFTSPIGEVHSFSWTVVPGSNRLVPLTQARSCIGCTQTDYRYIENDANGNMKSEKHFDGSKRCFSYESERNIEVVRIEGLNQIANCVPLLATGTALPVGARKVTTQWHPNWRLRVRVSEPGRLTTYVYNGQPDPFNGNATATCAPASAVLPDGKPIAVVCKQVVESTTDANGSQGLSATVDVAVTPRIDAWTYNENGQVLEHNGPRTDVNDLTQYVYYSDSTEHHTTGDLMSVTDAQGATTNFTKYNKHGQVLESSDANGVISSLAYDLRHRLTSTTTGGATTTFAYDAAGQMVRITKPDGSYVGFDYDPAHRLTARYDNLGNRLVYVLDAAGNRTEEIIKDSVGTDRKTIRRVFDAFGRLREQVGAD